MFSDLFHDDGVSSSSTEEDEQEEEEPIDYTAFNTKCVAQKRTLKVKAFGDVDYWDKQYSSTSNYEWYTKESYAPMCSTLLQLVSQPFRKQSKILTIGCGNSFFARHLIDIGFYHVQATDYSIEAIKFQLEKQSHLAGEIYSSIAYHCLNARDMMNVEASVFDIIIDRATLDAIDCEGVDGSVNEDVTVEVAAEVMRVLKQGGVFLILTCRRPSRRLETFVNIDKELYDILESKKLDMGDGQDIFLVAIRKK